MVVDPLVEVLIEMVVDVLVDIQTEAATYIIPEVTPISLKKGHNTMWTVEENK